MQVLKSLFLSSSYSAVVICLGLSFLVYVAWAQRRKKAEKKARAKLQAMLASGKTEAYALYPKIDELKCSGCGTCTVVCLEGDILQMIDGKATLVTPTKCVGHSLCYRSCPVDAIT